MDGSEMRESPLQSEGRQMYAPTREATLPQGARLPNQRLASLDSSPSPTQTTQFPPDRGLAASPATELTSEETHTANSTSHKPFARPSDDLQRRPTSEPRFKGFFRNAVSTRLQTSFVLGVMVQGLAVIALQAVVFARIQADVSTSNSQLRSLQVYLAIFLLAGVTELILAFDAVRLRNFLQLEMLLIFSGAMTAYAALEHNQIRDALANTSCGQESCYVLYAKVRGILIAIPVIIGVATLLMAAALQPLYKEFGWDVFKILGASLDTKRMFRWYQIFVCLLKFDLFFIVGFCMQFLILVPNLSTAEVATTITALPICVAVLVIAALSVRVESRLGMILWAIGWTLAMTYFVYKLVRVWYWPEGNNPYNSNQRSLTLFASVTIALLILTGAASVKVWRNFGRGLPSRLPHYSSGKSRIASSKIDPTDEEAAERVSID